MPLSEDSLIQMQAEDILIDSEDRIRLILDSVSAASIHRARFVNPPYRRATHGWKRDVSSPERALTV